MHINVHINASKVCFSAGDSCFMALFGNILPSAPLLFSGIFPKISSGLGFSPHSWGNSIGNVGRGSRFVNFPLT